MSAVSIAAALGVTGYALAVAPPAAAPLATAIGVAADPFGPYAVRFAAASVLLGLVPAITAVVARSDPRALGLRAPSRVDGRLVFVACVLAAGLGIVSATSSPLRLFYPFGRALFLDADGAPTALIVEHAAAYAVLYYLPWELTFRGALLAPLMRPDRESRGWLDGELVVAVTPQALVSSLLHIGHPAIELLGAFPFGLALGLLAVRSGSILPGLCIHASIGIALDVAILVSGG